MELYRNDLGVCGCRVATGEEGGRIWQGADEWRIPRLAIRRGENDGFEVDAVEDEEDDNEV
jgi:hypothetical protein